MIGRVLGVVVAFGAAFIASAGRANESYSTEEIQSIATHGPWPTAFVADPSNRVSGQAEAIALGRRLVRDRRLSGAGQIACTDCHRPSKAWQDGRRVGQGAAPLSRNTPSLIDVRTQRWMGWDGAADSVWSQNLRALLDWREMASTEEKVVRVLRQDRDLARRYQRAFGEPAGADATRSFVNVGKAMAAFLETLESPRTPFDDFRDALLRVDEKAMRRYPPAAQRGLKLFIGKGNCSLCHSGPNFSNGEFADIGRPFFVRPGVVDPGRHEGIQRLKQSAMSRVGPHADGDSGLLTRHIVLTPRNFGEFKIPSLRGLVRTAPYTHDGSLATLAEVVAHYSELNEERLHADGERLLRPLHLTDGERADLIAFLLSLSAPSRTR